MILSCPNKQCGRKFTQQPDLLAHVKRRHPEQMDKIQNILSKTVILKQKKIQQQLSKLPRLKLRPSQEKPNKQKQNNSINTKKIITASEIVSNSRLQVIKNQAITKPKLTRNLSKNSAGKKQLLPTLTQDNPYGLSQKKQMLPQLQQKLNNDNNKMSVTSGQFKVKKRNSLARENSAKDLLGQGQGKKKFRNSQFLNKTAMPGKHSFFSTKTSQSKVINQTDLTRSTMGQETIKSQIQIKKQTELVPKKQQVQEAIQYTFQTKVFVRKTSLKIFKPTFLNLQSLYLNGINLQDIYLNGLQCLIEFSATNNNLRSLEFLNFQQNQSLKIVHLDSNKIQGFSYLPPNISCITLAFNKIINLQQVCNTLSQLSKLNEIDLSFNPIKKDNYNYKLQLLLNGKQLKKIDGMKITKIDIDMAIEYKNMMDINNKRGKVIVSSKQANMSYYDRFHKKIQNEDMILQNEKITDEKYNDLKKELIYFEDKSKQIMIGLGIIQRQNEILQQQIKNMSIQMSGDIQIQNRYQQLKLQLQTLQMMNFLKYSDQQQIKQLIYKLKAK